MTANCQYCGKVMEVAITPDSEFSKLLKVAACEKCASFKRKSPRLFREWLLKKRTETPKPKPLTLSQQELV